MITFNDKKNFKRREIQNNNLLRRKNGKMDKTNLKDIRWLKMENIDETGIDERGKFTL